MLHSVQTPHYAQTMCFPAPAAAVPAERGDLSVAILGRFRSRGGFDHTQVAREPAIHLVTAGDGLVTVAGRTERVAAGDAFCLLPGERTWYRDRRGSPWRYTWLMLCGRRAREIVGQVGFTPERWVRRDLDPDGLASLLDEIEAAFRADAHGPLFPQAAAWRLLDRLAGDRPGDDPRGHGVAIAVHRILEREFHTGLGIGDLARRLRIDRSTLFRRFHELYGTSPKRFLDDLRLEHARALLRDPALGVAEVARRSGFASARYFSRAFRGRYGVPPSRMRGA